MTKILFQNSAEYYQGFIDKLTVELDHIKKEIDAIPSGKEGLVELCELQAEAASTQGRRDVWLLRKKKLQGE